MQRIAQQALIVDHPAQAIAVAVEFKPTVILQDIEMPAINGLDLLPQYRAHEALREVPVVMLTGKEDPAVKADAFARGASDYLVKLPNKVELVARVKHHSGACVSRRQRVIAVDVDERVQMRVEGVDARETRLDDRARACFATREHPRKFAQRTER